MEEDRIVILDGQWKYSLPGLRLEKIPGLPEGSHEAIMGAALAAYVRGVELPVLAEALIKALGEYVTAPAEKENARSGKKRKAKSGS
jgi:hypothetical protein